MAGSDSEPWGPGERLRDPRTLGIAFLMVCAATTATMFSLGGLPIHILGVLVVGGLSVVITTRSLARWRDERLQPFFSAFIRAGWGVAFLGVALWIKIA